MKHDITIKLDDKLIIKLKEKASRYNTDINWVIDDVLTNWL